MTLSKLFVLGTGAIFFVYGLLFFFIPVETFEYVVDGVVTSNAAITDLRATYGGMSVGVGVTLFMLGASPSTQRQGLIACLLLMAGMATGRAIGIAVDGDTNVFMLAYLALEILASIVALVLLKKTVADPDRPAGA